MNEILDKIAEAVNSCLGPLTNLQIKGSDVRDLLIQLCATILLFVVVRFFLWKPITDILEKRRKAIDAALASAKESSLAAKQLENELSNQLSSAKSDSCCFRRKKTVMPNGNKSLPRRRWKPNAEWKI